MVLIPTLIINVITGINNDLVMVLLHYALLINDVTRVVIPIMESPKRQEIISLDFTCQC